MRELIAVIFVLVALASVSCSKTDPKPNPDTHFEMSQGSLSVKVDKK